MIDHTFGEWQTVTENTCVSSGELRRECTVCGYTETEHPAADDTKHNYVAQEPVPATCEHAGYTEYVCQNDGCTASYRADITPALTHEWGEWQTTQAPTATTNGTAERTCSLCGATEQKTLPATAPVTGTTSNGGGDNSSTVWLIFGIIAGGVLVLGGGAVSWLFIAGRQRKKQVTAA